MRRLLASGFVLVALPAFAQAPTVTVSGDGAATVVSVGTQGPPGASASTAGIIADVKLYGALGNGTTDDSAAVIAAIAAVSTAGGGTVFFPIGTYRIDSQLLMPNDDASPVPHQKPIRLIGAGSHSAGIASPVNGGSVLDLKYAGTTAKLVTLGLGMLEIEGLTFKNTGTDSLAFIHTTNTSLHIRHSAFIGASAASPLQRGIVFGGQDATAGKLVSSYFQGYGTVIKDNYFDYLSAVGYFQVNANAIVFRDNSVWTDCAGTAAFEDWDSATYQNVGVVLDGNTIEVNHYANAIHFHRMNDGYYNNFIYDPSGATPYVSHYYFGAGSLRSFVLPGYANTTTYPLMTGAGSGATAVWLPSSGTMTLSDGSLAGYGTLIVGTSQVRGNSSAGYYLMKADGTEVGRFYNRTANNFTLIPVQADGLLEFFTPTARTLYQSADGQWLMQNDTSGSYTYLQIKGVAAQGTIPLTRWYDKDSNVGLVIQSDGNPTLRSYTAATLPASANGTLAYCSDCTKGGDPCATGGTGARATRIAGAWACN